MKGELQTVSVQNARRLTVVKQHLAGKQKKKVTREGILEVIGDLGYVQWDPINIVAPSHIISLWSRLGLWDNIILSRVLGNPLSSPD
jgi:hypothetical protein